MSAAEARDYNLPIPKRPVRGLTFRAQEARRRWIRARIPGLDATECVFPGDFLGHPDVPDPDRKRPLGPTGVIDYVRPIFDGTRTSGVPHGSLLVETF